MSQLIYLLDLLCLHVSMVSSKILGSMCFIQYSVFKVRDNVLKTLSYIINSQCHSLRTSCFAHVLVTLLLLRIMLLLASKQSLLLEAALLVITITFWHPPILPCRLQQSTVGRIGLNRRVRYGNGCVPYTYRHQNFCSFSLLQSIRLSPP